MFYDVFNKLCQERGIKPSPAAIQMGINKGSVSYWKTHDIIPSSDVLQKISEFFGVSVDFLMGNSEKKETPALTEKDERDISKKLQKTLEELENSQDGLMFDGQPLDDITKELLAASLRKDLEMGKRIAKQKYTPKKYRKPEGD